MKLFVFCLFLLGIFGASFAEDSENASQPPIPGGYQNMSANALNELFPRLSEAFTQFSYQNDNFDSSLKRIVSGEFQVVAGIHYLLSVEVTRETNNHVYPCEVDVIENIKGEFDKLKVECEFHDAAYSL